MGEAAQSAKPAPAAAAEPNSGGVSASCKSYLIILNWIVLSAAVILFNKYLLAHAGFPYPITLTLIHMLTCSVLAALLIHVGPHLGISIQKPSLSTSQYLKHIVPIGALFSLVLWLGNTVYLYLSVSFIQMLKASMPVAVFCVGVLMGTQEYSHKTALNMAVIGTGTAMASYGEVHFVLLGVLLQVAVIFCESFRLILIQKLMQHAGVKLDSIQTMYYVSPCCFVFLCIPFGIMEAPKLWVTPILTNPLLLGANALCAFALNVAVFVLIGNTNALTLNVAGVVKDWLLIALSWALFRAPITALQLVGYLVAFAGVKYFNNQRTAAQKASSSQSECKEESVSPSGAGSKDDLQPLVKPGSLARSADEHDSDDAYGNSNGAAEADNRRSR